MPNLGVSKEVKFQHRMAGSSVARRECRNNSDSSRVGMKKLLKTRTGNVVNVDTVETSPTIDNPESHPTARRHFGLSA